MPPRVALAAFLDACRRGRVAKGSVLLLGNLDRLSAQPGVVAQRSTRARALEDICAEGVDAVDLSAGGRRYSLESLNSDPMQFMVLTMHFMRANQESVMKIWPLRRGRAPAIGAGAGCTAIGIHANRAAGRAICVKPISFA